MVINAVQLQLEFIDKIRKLVVNDILLAEKIAELLDLSLDSSYRRLRCKTFFNIEEIAKICSHFKISFGDYIYFDDNKVVFDYLRLENQSTKFYSWLHSINTDLKRICDAKNKQIIFAAEDVPIFHHFHFDKLISFKLFYWLKSIINAPEFKDLKFKKELIDSDILQTAKEINQSYLKIPSIEIWTEDTLNSTLMQIQYFWESDFFENKNDAIELCDLIEEEINQLYAMVTNGNKTAGKSKGAEIDFYFSELMVGNNSILVKIGDDRISYVVKNTFHSMTTNDPQYTEDNELWLNNLIQKSVYMSKSNEKQRIRFFRLLHEKINRLRTIING